MPYELRFKPKALKEWSRLDKSVKEQFKKKLQERLENPHVPKDRLRGYADVYNAPRAIAWLIKSTIYKSSCLFSKEDGETAFTMS